MAKLIGNLKLRNERQVYWDEGNYLVAEIDPKGTEYRSPISVAAVERLYENCKGHTVTSAEASEKVAAFARAMQLPYYYGHKLEHYTLNMLVVLVVTGKANFWKEGRSYQFAITT